MLSIQIILVPAIIIIITKITNKLKEILLIYIISLINYHSVMHFKLIMMSY